MKHLILLAAAIMLVAAFGLVDSVAVRGAAGLLFVYVWIPLLVVITVDVLRAKRGTPGLSIPRRLLAAIPEGVLGLTSLIMGAAIIAWVLYNLLIERQPEYTGPSTLVTITPFGVGTPLVVVGVYWMRRALSRSELEIEPDTSIRGEHRA